MLTPLVWATLFGIAGALLIGPFGAVAGAMMGVTLDSAIRLED